MKALIKGGLCLALGWLANGAEAQEIRWRAADPKNSSNIAVVSSSVESNRPVSVGQPVPLESRTGSFAPIVRGQAADEKVVPQPIPEIIVGNQPPSKQTPKKNGFTPPPPQPAPGPVFGSLGMTPENGFGDCCGGDLCGAGGRAVSDRPLWWASGEYLMWWQRGQSVPPLVTSSPAGTPIATSGLIGQPSTDVLYDGTPDRTRGGGRFSVGRWMPHFCNLGLDVNFFFLGRQDETSVFGSNGDPQISRPFFNAITNKQAAEIVSFNNPNAFVAGTVSVHSFSQLWGLDANLRSRWYTGCDRWLDVLVGYRHLNLSEGIEITENLQNFDPGTRAPAGHFLVQDSFRTRNQFNGVQIGLDGECRFWNRWFLGATTKVALGSVHQMVTIDGQTTFTNFPAPFGGTFPGGLLALPNNNIGRFTENRFAVLPEVSVRVGLDVTDHCRLFVGYNFLYLSSVVRPGEQIDLNVNPNYIPSAAGPGPGGGPRAPAVLFRTTDYWAQGFTFGMMYRY